MAQGRKTGGRTKGTPNKMTGALKDMILQALNEADPEGGVEYLKKQASQSPTAFLGLVGKVLPLQIAGDADNPLRAVMRVELVGLTNDHGADSPTA